LPSSGGKENLMERRGENERFEKIEAQIGELKSRVSILEEGHGLNGEAADGLPEVLELDLELPRMDIGGLHFNRQEVTGVFELKDNGWYHCRNILFLSARNTGDNSRDILSEYLQSGEVKEAFAAALRNAGIEAGSAEVSLPSENGGIKQYHGVDWWYWFLEHDSGSAATFCYVSHYGLTNYSASSVGGCAPAFRVRSTQKI
jgi:hypothetical protein